MQNQCNCSLMSYIVNYIVTTVFHPTLNSCSTMKQQHGLQSSLNRSLNRQSSKYQTVAPQVFFFCIGNLYQTFSLNTANTILHLTVLYLHNNLPDVLREECEKVMLVIFINYPGSTFTPSIYRSYSIVVSLPSHYQDLYTTFQCQMYCEIGKKITHTKSNYRKFLIYMYTT